ncbi:MAG: hypothetical protein GY859_06330, partial [Desulfobacterales bacterium]|nr:hypothetical protein [Desulfobacterales bacterium]
GVSRKKADDSRPRKRELKKKEAGKPSRDKKTGQDPAVKEPPGDPDACWTPQEKTISIQGFKISGGLFYAGEHLWNLLEQGVEPALIRPSLTVAPRSINRKITLSKSRLSYTDLSPGARAAYLKWLADGRRAPKAQSSCLFLFLFGLERRALFDAPSSEAARARVLEIVQEIRKLLSIHEAKESFNKSANSLLDALQAARPNEPILGSEPPRPGQPANPWRIQFTLGRMVAEDKPIPWNWALAWVMNHPDAGKRSASKRCPDELGELFARRYGETFGEGVRFEASKRQIQLQYRPLNPVLNFERVSFKIDLPEPEASKELKKRLFAFFAQCQADLEPYSRAVDGASESRESLPALALLPGEMIASRMGPAARKFRAWAIDASRREPPGEKKTEAPGSLVEVDRLLNAWGVKKGGGLPASEAKKLIRLLEKWGVGVEPDPRFGGPPFQADGKAVLFELPDNAPAEPGPDYIAADFLMRLSVMVAAANGDPSDDEKAYLIRHVESELPLTRQEKTRLLARLRWLFTAAPGEVRVKERPRGVPEEDRRDMGRFLIELAGVDGPIHPDEITLLGKFYRILDLDPGDVHDHVHEFTKNDSPGSGPATGGDQENRSESDPPGKGSDPGDATQDASRDMADAPVKMDETGAAPAAPEETPAGEKESAADPSPGAGKTPAGLDAHHTALFRVLARRPSWPRKAFKALALKCRLSPDGALENINKAAMDIADKPLCKGDDPLVLDPYVLKKMLK